MYRFFFKDIFLFQPACRVELPFAPSDSERNCPNNSVLCCHGYFSSHSNKPVFAGQSLNSWKLSEIITKIPWGFHWFKNWFKVFYFYFENSYICFRVGTSCRHRAQEAGSSSALPRRQPHWWRVGPGRDAGRATERARRLPDSAGSGRVSRDAASCDWLEAKSTELLTCLLMLCCYGDAISKLVWCSGFLLLFFAVSFFWCFYSVDCLKCEIV